MNPATIMMLFKTQFSPRRFYFLSALALAYVLGQAGAMAQNSNLLFEDHFDRGIPGWTAVQPVDPSWLDGPMRWLYDINNAMFVEDSNIYSGPAAASASRAAVMLVNETEVTADEFTLSGRLLTSDDDGFGFVFGYQDENNFYRITFGTQPRSGWPYDSWHLDRRVDNQSTALAGDDGSDEFSPDWDPEIFKYTIGQPFDVTIQVTGGNRLTITVVDDPDVWATPYTLVEDFELPTDAKGRVGLMSWGQRGPDGRPFSGANFYNVELTPGGLAGNPNALEAWTPFIPTNRAGSDELTRRNVTGRWGLGLGQNGSFGTLQEHSNAYMWGTDDDGTVQGGNGNTHADFIGSSIAAGDVSWTDYLVYARVMPRNQQGHGLILRHQDSDNFYRISLAVTGTSPGRPIRGLSVQKKVNGVWEQVFWERHPEDPADFDRSDPQFLFRTPGSVYAAGLPYDILASIQGDELSILIVDDPEGSPQAYSYGPIQFTGETLSNGRIGFHNWANLFVEFDFVQVYAVEAGTTALQVSSPFGDPSPAPGVSSFETGSEVTASVTSPFEDQPGVRRVATGWSGLGSAPTSGTGSSATFTLSQLSRIEWEWETEVRLAANAGAGGRVLVNGEILTNGTLWVAEGEQVSLSAEAEPGFIFLGWAGDTFSSSAEQTLVLNRPISVTARFASDSTGDGLPDEWKLAHFGTTDVDPAGDPDEDGRTNAEEFHLGTDPLFAEPHVFESNIALSLFENVQRDPILPAWWVVRDFGDGYRGVWENSNNHRQAVDATRIGADNVVPLVSFDGPRLIVREEFWDPAWNDYTVEAVFVVGDDDGNNLYFRYQDELNWYRLTIVGENNPADWRAPYGVSVAKRVDGVFTELLRDDESIATDPSDTSWFKQVRMTVEASGSDFEVRIEGWDTFSFPAAWGFPVVLSFTDTDLPTGRAGIGAWGQGGHGAGPTELIPVDNGVLIQDFKVTVNGDVVLEEDWSGVPLPEELPEGWENPLAIGDWIVSAHGTIVQRSNFGPATTGTVINPKADAEGPILLAPAPGVDQYLLELGFHPFDDDGVGFVYDYLDADNYARVLFVSEASAAGRIPQGVNISRKENGEWTDLVAGDNSFIYEPGSPFRVQFSSNNGQYRMIATLVDDPGQSLEWRWDDSAARPENRYGFAAWASVNAHFFEPQVWGLVTLAATDLSITGASVVGDSITIEVGNASGQPYSVQVTTDLAGGEWTTVASDQTGAQWTGSIPAGATQAFWRLVQ